MDEIVEQALRRWPDVPHCTGWLRLDARGQWRMRDEAALAARASGTPIRHATLLGFIHRNYGRDERGQWFFQNGPQRVYVELEYTPWVVRLARDATGALTLTDQTGQPFEPAHVWLDDAGSVLFTGAAPPFARPGGGADNRAYAAPPAQPSMPPENARRPGDEMNPMAPANQTNPMTQANPIALMNPANHRAAPPLAQSSARSRIAVPHDHDLDLFADHTTFSDENDAGSGGLFHWREHIALPLQPIRRDEVATRSGFVASPADAADNLAIQAKINEDSEK